MLQSLTTMLQTGSQYSLIALLLLCTGCASTLQGKSVDRGNMWDGGTTLARLAGGAAEGNPIAVYMVPFKILTGKWVDKKWANNCIARAEATGVLNTISYAAAGNNIAFSPIGLLAGPLYYFYRNKIEPDTYSCIPKVDSLERFARAYKKGDAKAITEAFTEDAFTPDAIGREAIQADYAKFFSTNQNRWVKWRTYDEKTGEGEMWVWVDGSGGPYQVSIAFNDDGLIESMVW